MRQRAARSISIELRPAAALNSTQQPLERMLVNELPVHVELHVLFNRVTCPI